MRSSSARREARSPFPEVLLYGSLLTSALVVTSACGSFGAASSSDAPVDVSDAATTDATPASVDGSVATDASSAIDAAARCQAGAVCYDFEGNTDGVSITGDCSVVDTAAHRGAHSAHCKGPSPSYFEIEKAFVPGGPFAFRAFVRGIPPASLPSPSVGYIGLIDTSLAIPRMMVGDANAHHYDLWWTSGMGGGFISSQVSDGSPSWTCVEAVFALPNSLSYFVNGTQVDFTRIDAELGSTPLSFRWGLPYMLNPDAFEAYVDDIAIGTTRLGCE